METLCLTIANRLDQIGPLARHATAFLQSNEVDPDATFAVDLALEELVSNVIKYGYKNGDSKEIYVRLDVGRDQIKLLLEDSAPPFNPLNLPEPDLDKPIEQRPIGGLGVFLVRKTVDRIEYERLDDRNVLRITVVRRHA